MSFCRDVILAVWLLYNRHGVLSILPKGRGREAEFLLRLSNVTQKNDRNMVRLDLLGFSVETSMKRRGRDN